MDQTQRPFARRGLLGRAAPFMGALLLGFALLPLPPHEHPVAASAGAALVLAMVAAAAWFLPWDRLPSWSEAVPPLSVLVAVVLLRHGAGGASSGYAPLALLPVIWLSLYGTRAQLALSIAGSAAVFAIPVLVHGEPLYPASEWRRAALWPFVACVVGFSIHNLVNRVRDVAADAKERAEELGAVVDAMSDGLVVADADGRFRLFNREAEKILGVGAVEGGPSTWAEQYGVFLPDGVTSAPPAELPLVRALHGESVSDMELVVRNPKLPGDVWIAVSGRPLRGPNGAVRGGVAVFHDISQRKEVLRQIEAAREQALEASRLKSQFLANMSHEVRTPMNGVIGMTELLLDTELNEEQMEYVRMLRDSGEALLDVVNDILDLSKIEAGKLELESATFDLRATVEDTCDLLAKRAHDKGLELTVAIEAAVPPAVNGDRARLRQVLVNLLSNAIKFTQEGEVAVHVSASAAGDGRCALRVTVSDTGIGIDPARAHELFEPFSQADRSTTRRFGGTGLGLTISKQLVGLMDGEIGVRSRPDAGSTFWFEVPLEPRPGPGRAADLQPAAPELQGMRVLIVDDNPTNRRVLTSHARTWDLRADTAASAAEGLRMMERARGAGDPYRAAIVDWHMPEMNGVEMGRRAAAQGLIGDTAMIMLSSAGESARERDPLFCAHIRKPVRRARLYEALAGVAGGHPSEPTPPASPSGEVTRADRVRVLVAEDNVVNRAVVSRMLEKQGYSFDLVSDGAEALQALERDLYAAVLMDCHMPRMDGYEATRRLRSREGDAPHTPVIAMTASAMQGDRERCLAAGMDDYITKPLEPELLTAVLDRWTGTQEDIGGEMVAALERRVGAAGSPGLINDLVDLFLRDTPDRIAAIEAALAAGDPAGLREAAHAMQGSSRTFGAGRIADLCRTLEEKGAAGSVAGAEELLDQLRKEYRGAEEALRQTLRRREGTR